LLIYLVQYRNHPPKILLTDGALRHHVLATKRKIKSVKKYNLSDNAPEMLDGLLLKFVAEVATKKGE